MRRRWERSWNSDSSSVQDRRGYNFNVAGSPPSPDLTCLQLRNPSSRAISRENFTSGRREACIASTCGTTATLLLFCQVLPRGYWGTGPVTGMTYHGALLLLALVGVLGSPVLISLLLLIQVGGPCVHVTLCCGTSQVRLGWLPNPGCAQRHSRCVRPWRIASTAELFLPLLPCTYLDEERSCYS